MTAVPTCMAGARVNARHSGSTRLRARGRWLSALVHSDFWAALVEKQEASPVAEREAWSTSANKQRLCARAQYIIKMTHPEDCDPSGTPAACTLYPSDTLGQPVPTLHTSASLCLPLEGARAVNGGASHL